MNQLTSIWEKTMDRIKLNLPTSKVYDSWLAPANPVIMNSISKEFTVEVDDELHKSMIEKKYKEQIEEELFNVTGIN